MLGVLSVAVGKTVTLIIHSEESSLLEENKT